MEIPATPFAIMVLGPFAPVGTSRGKIERHSVTVESLDAALAAVAPRLWIPVPKEICPEGGLSIEPRRMKDLKAEGIAGCTPYLKDLRDAEEFIGQSRSRGMAPEKIAQEITSQWPAIPLDLSLSVKGTKGSGSSAVDDLLSMVAMPDGPQTASTGGAGPEGWKGQLETLLAENLRHVFAHPEWRIFEAAWRGLEVLVRQGGIREGAGITVNIVPLSGETLQSVLKGLTSDLTTDLPGLILVDVPFDQTPRSLEVLGEVAAFAGQLLVPTAVWVTPRFFFLESWQKLQGLPYLRNHMEDNAAYAKWRGLRKNPDAHWLVAACNRFLARPPYGDDFPARIVPLEEDEALWVSPVYALGALVAQSVGAFGWPSRFTDYTAVKLENLPVLPVAGSGSATTESVIPDDRLRQLKEVGITPLAGASMKDIAFIPKETTVSGESLALQLFFSRIIGFLMRCRDDFYDRTPGVRVEEYVMEALAGLFRAAGDDPPEDLSVKAGASGDASPLPLEITFTPPKRALHGATSLSFAFAW